MYLLAACMGAAVLIGAWQYGAREDGRKADKNSIRIGVLLYRGDDTFIGTLRTGLEDKAKEYEQETGIKVKPVSYTHLDVYKRQVLCSPYIPD